MSRLTGRLDIAECVTAGRSPLVLADRKVHLDRLENAFAVSATGTPCFWFDGQLGKKARNEVLLRTEDCYGTGKAFVLFSTASLIGEGFDLPRLDTLILSMPLSFKGRLIQYAGRLNRVHESKRDPLIFDYLDGNHALTNAMFRRRLAGYKELGYQVEMPQDAAPVWFEAIAGDAE